MIRLRVCERAFVDFDWKHSNFVTFSLDIKQKSTRGSQLLEPIRHSTRWYIQRSMHLTYRNFYSHRSVGI